ncbi:MAG: peptidase [Lachnospiraceae bacterium]|nr:peptidase [Lachnospiraceae bacterium]
MKKKKISLKLVTLVMSGTLLATPMVSSAEEVGNNSTTISTNTSESTEGTGSTATASENTAGTGSTMSTSAALAGTGSAVESAASAGTGSAVESAASAGTSSPAGTVTVTPVDPSTTLPNNVDTVIPSDEMKGTKIESSIWGRHIEYDPDLGIEAAPVGPGHTEIKVNISPEESKGEETLSPTFGSAFFNLDKPDNHPSRDVADDLRTRKNNDFVIKGDLSIAKDDSTEEMDSTDTAPHTVKSEESYILKAEYDVSAVANSRETFGKFFPYGVENVSNESPLVKTAKAELGFRSSFSLGTDLNGSFYVPESSEDAKAHYTLKSADGNTLLYRINYAKSSFSKDKVSLQMDFDVQDGVEHNAGTLQSFTNLLKNSAKKIQIIAKGLRLDNASGRRTVTDTAEETRRSVEGTIQNTLVGYMNSTSSYLYRDHSEEDINSQTIPWKGDSYDLHNAFQWGAIQSDSGRDFVSGKDALSGIENDKILLTVQFTDLVKKNQPVNPGQNGNPGGNSGNGGNGGNGITDRTPVNPNPSVTSTPTNPGSVLGEDRPMPVEKTASTEGEASPVQEGKDGAVLGAERTRRKGAVLGAERERNGNALNKRSAVSTGDARFAGLWASLSALSLLSLAGYVVVRKKGA